MKTQRKIGSSASPRTALRRLALLLAVAAAAVAALPAMAQTKVRVGVVGTASDSVYYIAQDRGYFKKEGLEVEFIPFKSASNMVAPLGADQLDVGGGTVSAGLYNAVSRDVSVRIVADKGSIQPGYAFSGLMVRKDLMDAGKYKSYKDLKGMKVAIGAEGTSTASALNEALKRGGLKYSDVEIVDLGFPQHIAAYANKGIDASITNEPTMTRAIEAGLAVRVAGNDVIYPYQQTSVLLYSENLIKSKPDVGLRFMRAYLRGLRDYNDVLRNGHISGPGSDEVIAILTKSTAVKDAEIYRKISPPAADPDGKVNVKSLEKDLAFFRSQGLVGDTKITAASLMDTSFVTRAVQQLGPYKKKVP